MLFDVPKKHGEVDVAPVKIVKVDELRAEFPNSPQKTIRVKPRKTSLQSRPTRQTIVNVAVKPTAGNKRIFILSAFDITIRCINRYALFLAMLMKAQSDFPRATFGIYGVYLQNYCHASTIYHPNKVIHITIFTICFFRSKASPQFDSPAFQGFFEKAESSFHVEPSQGAQNSSSKK